MDAEQIRRLEPELMAYLGRFGDCFGRVEPAEHLRRYVRGQLSDLPRKSIEPMADAAGIKPRDLQHFLAMHKWDDDRMRDRIAEIVACDHDHPCPIGVLDETGHPKKGHKTPGVQRQWCGNTGKKDNCVVTVHLGYVAGEFHCLLDGELFLPESWSDDRERCRAAGVPDEMVHRTKWRIALELYEQAIANGVRFAWLTFDEGYGQTPALLHELDRRGQRYVAEVPTQFAGWLRKPDVLHREHHSRPMGRPRTYPRLTAQSPTTSFVKDLFKSSPILRAVPWERFHVKDTQKGPMVWQAKAAAFYLKRDRLPTRAHWLIVARNVLNPDETKFFVSNAPQSTPLEILLHVAFSRWHVERCFQDEKDKLGLSHFEVRNYRSLRRHWTITAVSHLFLAKTQHKWRGEKPGPDGQPTPPGDRRLPASRPGSRSGQNAPPATRRQDHHTASATQRQSQTVPSTCQTQATPPTRDRSQHAEILRAG